MDASLPTTLAVLSALKGIRTSSQFFGLKTLTFVFLSLLMEWRIGSLLKRLQLQWS